MGLKEQVQTDLAASMRARDEDRTRTLRLLRAAIQNLEVARTDPNHDDYGRPVSEDDLAALVERQLKQRRDSIEAFRKGGREDLVAKEQSEVAVLQQYRPALMSRDEIAAHVRGIVAEVGPDFKTVMPRAARELRGRADGREVNEVVRELTQ
ncbi:MAG TPA: GatB/YqeY domain-containing protein [Chloroflexota bacterium]